MTLSAVLGILVVTFPFIYLFIHIGKYDGWNIAFAVYGLTILVMAFVMTGMALLTGVIVF